MALLLGTICTVAVQAQDAETDVRAFLQQRDRDIKAAIAGLNNDPSQEEHVRSLVNDRIDFREMGRRALGDHDATLTEEQRSRYIDTFSAIVRVQSLSDLTVYNAKVTFGEVAVSGGTARVYTHAEVDGAQVPVEYVLHDKDGEWWLYDIILDGVGTIEGYAVSFQSVIRKRGFDHLMASLDRKLRRIESGN